MTIEALHQIRLDRHWAALSELIDAFEACGQIGWDGDEGEPISVATYRYAREFLAALPAAFPAPEVSASGDGTISFDWFPGPRSLFSVPVTEEGRLVFAAVTPSGRSSGVERFDGRLPNIVADTLRRLF